MKIHYTSGHFYIEKDGKKIKIANPEELPVEKTFTHGIIWWFGPVGAETYSAGKPNIKEGDTFDLPKELSVEIKDACNSDCCTMDGACGSNCRSPLKVAHLSKSSSPEIPDSSEKYYSIDEHNIIYAAHAIMFLSTFIASVKNKKTEDLALLDIRNALDWTDKLKELIAPSPPTIAVTSTEPYADFIDGSTYVKTNDSELSNSSEKPDFFSIAIDILKVKRGAYSMAVKDMLVELGEEIWSVYVVPRDKTISDLRERVKQADALFNGIKQSQDVIPSWMKEAYENYAKGKR